MGYYGYAGSVLYVDLSTGSVRKEDLDLDLAEKLVGGWGMNQHLAFEHLQPGTDPYAPENPLVIGAGPLVGTLAPSSSKVVATTKYPIPASPDDRHFVGTATGGGGRFGIMLKNAGFDHVVITGRAPRPCYLAITDEGVEIRDASDLWGRRDTYQTIAELKRRHPGSGVWAIGRAGENRVRIAHALVDRNHLGRHLAGVLGAKNLKAVVTCGRRGVKVSHEKQFMSAVDRARETLVNRPLCRDLSEYEGVGAARGMSAAFREAYPEELFHRTNVDIMACSGCITPCRASFAVPDGEFAGETVKSTHLSMVAIYGTRLRLLDYRQAMRMVDLCNRNGLDLLATVQMIAFVTRLYARGDISRQDTDGLELRRDFDCYVDLINKIANRDGFGDTLADGWYALHQKIGVSPWEHFDGTGIIKGVDANDDARTLAVETSILGHVVQPRGGHQLLGPLTHNPGQPLSEVRQIYEKSLALSPEQVARYFTPESYDVARLVKIAEDADAFYNSAGFCYGPATMCSKSMDLGMVADLYAAATGIEVDPPAALMKGERAVNLCKVLNVREGFTRQDDAWPSLWLKATVAPAKGSSGEMRVHDYLGRALSANDLHRILDSYYDERGWDLEHGIPSGARLEGLGLGELGEVVQPVLKY